MAQLEWARAGMADALAGEGRQAVMGFKNAQEQLTSQGQAFEAALIALDAAYLMPNEPEVRSWADEARATFERLGAKPSLERLDAALASSGPTPGPMRVPDREAMTACK